MKWIRQNWKIEVITDDDNHLNIYIENMDESNTVLEIDTGQGSGRGEQLALRFTTPEIEKAYVAYLKATEHAESQPDY